MSDSTREHWLIRSLPHLSRIIEANDGTPVNNVYVSIGFPSRGALSKRTTLGQCFPEQHTETGLNTILISPLLSDPVEILATLLHEMIHASVGCKHGHRAPFSQMAKRCGLDGKPTATFAGEELKAKLEKLAEKLGPLPHSALNVDRKEKKQSTRMRLYECDECGQKIRAATDELEAQHILDGEPCGMFAYQAK